MSDNVVRLGSEDLPVDKGTDINTLVTGAFRRKLESWLAALLQSEHLSLLVGNGLSVGIGSVSGVLPPLMDQSLDAGSATDAIRAHSQKTAERVGRNSNVEDELRSALALAEGLDVLGETAQRDGLLGSIDSLMNGLLKEVLKFERALYEGSISRDEKVLEAQRLLQRFMVPFVSRAVGRDRLSLFTTNYDRLLEFTADLLGVRLMDRFIGSLEPTFSASRLDIDMHYSPPGIRGEPRYLEGVARLAKLHGSVDWRSRGRAILKAALPFGAAESHPAVPEKPSETLVIYPNPAKDVETLAYPYAELFRDFAAAICRRNAVLVTYGYGFGDGHINRVIADMLTIPSTHLVVISFSSSRALDTFKASTFPPDQTTELIGEGIARLDNIVEVLPSLASFDLLERQVKHADARSRLRLAVRDNADSTDRLPF